MKKLSPLLLALLISIQLHAKERLNFLIPAHPALWGVRQVYVSETSFDDSLNVDFTRRLLNNLEHVTYFNVFDDKYLEENFKEIFYIDSISIDEKQRIACDSLGVQVILKSYVEDLSLGPDEDGSEEVMDSVWTGDYKRNKIGHIIYDNIDGDSSRLKIIEEKMILKKYRYRKAQIRVKYAIHDFYTNALLMGNSIVHKYNSGKIYESEYKNLISYFDIADSLVESITAAIVEQIAPTYREQKRYFDEDGGLFEEAKVYAIEGLYEEAIEVLNEAEHIYPGHSSLYYNLGLIYEAVGEYEQAASFYKKAILMNDENRYYRKALENIEENSDRRLKLIKKGMNP